MKKIMTLIFGILMLVLLGNLVSAVCCGKLENSGNNGWCISAENEEQCDGDYYAWTNVETCDSIVECEGTCVNLETGECSYSSKFKCEAEGGTWYEEDEDEVPACQQICCVLGENAYFINPTECKNLFTTYGIKGTMRNDITSRDECEEISTSITKGACVITTELETTCLMTTNTECDLDNEGNLVGNLQYAYRNIDFDFKENFLCTAEILNTNCARSEETECKNNKVYYKDTCGNFANVFDSNKYNDNDYWTYLKNPDDNTEVCTVSSSGSSTCGNCDATLNTACQSNKDAGLPNPNHNSNNLVCGDLSCRYQGKTYEHGESWCTGTEGTLIIEADSETGYITEESRSELENQDEYNLPGSRYYKLLCSYGEILVEECSDYRNQVCIQTENEAGRNTAACTFNEWRTCFELETKTACEGEGSLCKWVEGYRWDFETVSENEREEGQGSCVPLIAPGFDFWEADTQANSICEMTSVKDAALFETNWWTKRENFADWSNEIHSQRCVNGCYLIPGYGEEFDSAKGLSDLENFYNEYQFPLQDKISNYHLSLRSGQYCHKDGDETQWLTGGINYVSGSGKTVYDCTPGLGSKDKSLRKMRDYPIFLTHQQWISSITERARSMGDCGYKENIDGEAGDPTTEIVTAIFQMLDQKGNVKRNISAETVIYMGGEPVEGELYVTELPYEVETYSCASDYGGICTSTVNNNNVCEGGEINEQATCPANAVCCVYETLE